MEETQYFRKEGRTLDRGSWHFMEGFDNLLETILYYLTLTTL